MIFNRTAADVSDAISIREEKIKKFAELSDTDITSLERGMMTVNTLNRIESKQEELKGLFNSMGYWNTPVTNKAWTATEIFDEGNFQRLIDNLNVLRNAFFVYTDTPATPSVSFHYEDINSLEKILYDLERMVNDVKSRYRRCGTFRCGEAV